MYVDTHTHTHTHTHNGGFWPIIRSSHNHSVCNDRYHAMEDWRISKWIEWSLSVAIHKIYLWTLGFYNLASYDWSLIYIWCKSKPITRVIGWSEDPYQTAIKQQALIQQWWVCVFPFELLHVELDNAVPQKSIQTVPMKILSAPECWK